MLEAIVEKMELGAELPFCELSCCRTAFSDDDWHPQTTSDEQRFIAEVGSGAGFIDLLDAGGLTAVSTGKNVEANPDLPSASRRA